MLQKDLRRGERRWRSFHAWMRRLQDDWWTHGTRLNPRGVYNHMKETGICVIKRGDNWKERFYCECFEFHLQGSYRFKDTPTGNESEAAFRRNDGYFDKRIWEERNAVFDDESRASKWGKGRKRERREGMHSYKVRCFTCGFFLKTVEVENGSWYRSGYMERCEGCKEKEKKRRQAA